MTLESSKEQVSQCHPCFFERVAKVRKHKQGPFNPPGSNDIYQGQIWCSQPPTDASHSNSSLAKLNCFDKFKKKEKKCTYVSRSNEKGAVPGTGRREGAHSARTATLQGLKDLPSGTAGSCQAEVEVVAASHTESVMVVVGDAALTDQQREGQRCCQRSMRWRGGNSPRRSLYIWGKRVA